MTTEFEPFPLPDTLPTLFQRPDRIAGPLYVITPVFNAARFRSRWTLFQDFSLRVAQAGAVLYVVEVALGDRDFVVTDKTNPRHLQLRTWDVMWFKENMINLCVQRLPLTAQKIAWIDADVRFARDDWANETLQQLEHYPVVQLWSHAQDLSSEHEPMQTHRAFASVWTEYGPNPPKSLRQHVYYYGGVYPGHPGYAWAARREWWQAYGGLMDYQILGSADTMMAHAMVGELRRIARSPKTSRLNFLMHQWQQRGVTELWQGRPFLGNLGVIDGLLLHFWHGSKSNRQYRTRRQILVKRQFNPDLDLQRDWQGLYRLTDRDPQLRRDLQRYAMERKEDQESD